MTMRMRSTFDATVANLDYLTPTQHWTLSLSFPSQPSTRISNKACDNIERCREITPTEYWKRLLIKVCKTVIKGYHNRALWKGSLSCEYVHQLCSVEGSVGVLVEKIHVGCKQCRCHSKLFEFWISR